MNKIFIQVNKHLWVNVYDIQKIIKTSPTTYSLITTYVPYNVEGEYAKQLENLLLL